MAYPQRGYPRLAALMSKDKNIAIFRRFDDLNILCLLSLQAEIVQLETEFKIQCNADDTPGSQPALEYSSNFKLARDKDSTQHAKLKLIRERVKEYNELLIQVLALGQADKPLKSQLKSLNGDRGWLVDRDGGNNFLTGYETRTWESNNLQMYMCLESLSAKGDPFTRWLLNTAVHVYERLIGRYIGTRIGAGEIIDERTGDKSYGSDSVDRASNIITAVIASAIPVLAIYALNRIPTTEVRIGATAGFTVLFAVLMGYFSSAKRSELIAATATFTAIEVVFIGSAISAGDSGSQHAGFNGTVPVP